MKRPADFEGRIESAGPLFDVIPTRTEAEIRRAESMANVALSARLRDPAWETEATAQVAEYARTHEHFATEDVRAAFGTPASINPKSWGPVMKHAQALGIIQADGFVLVNCSNRSPRVRWKSLVFRADSASANSAQRPEG